MVLIVEALVVKVLVVMALILVVLVVKVLVIAVIIVNIAGHKPSWTVLIRLNVKDLLMEKREVRIQFFFIAFLKRKKTIYS